MGAVDGCCAHPDGIESEQGKGWCATMSTPRCRYPPTCDEGDDRSSEECSDGTEQLAPCFAASSANVTASPPSLTPPEYDLGFECNEDFLREQAEILEQIQRQQQQRQDICKLNSTEKNNGGSSSSLEDEVLPALHGSISCAVESESAEAPPVAQGSRSGAEPEESRTRFLLNDTELIREQQRLYDEIRRARPQPVASPRLFAPKAGTGAVAAVRKRPPQSPSTESSGVSLRKSSPGDLEKAWSVPSLASHPTVATESSTEASTSLASSAKSRSFRNSSRSQQQQRRRPPSSSGGGDRVTRLSNGRTLRVRGTEHAYRAISDGTALLVRCAGCMAFLQVPSKCTAVYCASCHDVTPLELAKSLPPPTAAGARASSSANSSNSSGYDGSVAAALQRQEFEAAEARKLSKMAQA